MAAMKLAIFFFTLSPLPGSYHARHLHDGYIYQRFDRRPPVTAAEVIQMVTGEEPRSPHGGENLLELEASPSSNRPPSDGESIYGGDYPKAPLPPKVAPSQGQTVYGGEKPKESPSTVGPSPEDQTIHGRDSPKAPPPPKLAPSRGQTTYGGDNPNANRFGRDDPTTPPSPDPNEGDNQGMYGRFDPVHPMGEVYVPI